MIPAIYLENNGEWVAAGEWQGFMVPFVGENANDNVALAAAAPDLLDALESAIICLDTNISKDFEAYEKALAAIAKARKQPPPFNPSSIANRKTS